MRNLKKLFAVVVVIAVVLTTMIPAAFAEGTTALSADAKACADIGMLSGDGSGVTAAYTQTQPARIQALVMILRLKGVLAAAQATSATADNFSDVKAAWEKPLTAYAKAHPELGFVGSNNKFDPDSKIDAKQYYSVMLTALGYKAPDDYTWATVLSKAASVGLTKNLDVSKFTVNDLAAATIETLKAKVKGSDKTLVETLADADATFAAKAKAAGLYNFTTDLTVKSATFVDARTISVKFNKTVNQGAAQTSGNYTLNGVAIPGGGSTTYALQDDKQTVLITVPYANKFANNTSYLLKVANVQDTTGVVMPNAYVNTLTLSDSIAPTLGAVTYVDNNTAKVSFSEPMLALAGTNVRVYDDTGADVTAAGMQIYQTTPFGNGDKDLLIDISGCTANKVYTVKIYGAVDISGNFAGTQTFTVTKTNADTTAPTIVSVVAKSLSSIEITFSEKVKADTVTTANGWGSLSIDGGATAVIAAAAGTLDTTGTKLTVTTAAQTAGLHSVAISNYNDLSNNKQTTVTSKVIDFENDTTKPAYVSNQVLNIAGTDYLVVKFSENVTAGVPTNALKTGGTYVKDNVQYTIGSAFGGNPTLYDPDGDGTSDSVKISLATAPSNGVYNVSLVASTVLDGASNANDETAITFNYNASTATNKPAVLDDTDTTNGISSLTAQGASGLSANEIMIQFTRDVSDSTALNAANYLVDGVAVFKSAIFVGDKHHVKLTLNANAITVTALRAFRISGIADTNGIMMDPVTFVQSFSENVAPTVKSAALTAADNITVKFSETMTAASVTDADDFEVYVGGVKVTIDSVTGSGDTYVIVLDTPLVAGDLAKDIVVKVVASPDATDAASAVNTIVGGASITVTK